MSNKLIVMVKDGISYINVRCNREDYLVNLTVPTPCKGSEGWVQVKGPVAIIQRKGFSSSHRIGFRLIEKYKTLLPSLPAEQPADAFTWDSDECCWQGEHAEFYETVNSERTETLQEVAFEVIDLNCEPVDIPQYVQVDFPGCVSQHPETWHKYPCTIGYQQVFDLIWDEVKGIVSHHPDTLSMDDYKSIQTCTVQQRVLIPSPARKTRKVSRNIFAKKQKFDTVTDTVRLVTLLQFIGKFKDRGEPYIQVREVKGRDYADLQANLAAYIATFTDRLDPTQMSVCHHCFGIGVVKTKDQAAHEEVA